MATIRVRDWTKERLEEILEAESHSSHDSVIKTLLKDRELARYAGTEAAEDREESTVAPDRPEGAFEDLTVLAEVADPDTGLLFLWCPNCGNEIAHVELDGPARLSVFEAECQRCLNRLDQHVVVAIEIGYPIEQRLVEGTLQADLRSCVVDYWDRMLERYAAGGAGLDLDETEFVRQVGSYYREFDWDWPEDVPVVALEVGRTYRDVTTGDRLEVLDVDSQNRSGLDDYRVRRHADDHTESDVLDSSTVTDRVVNRALRLEE